MAEAKKKRTESPDEYIEKVLNVRRVAKVITGGRRFAFSALVVVGDGQGRVGVSFGKSREVASAIAKAIKRARANMVEVPLYKTTVPFPIEAKHGASKVIIRSAVKGTGVIAGGAVRAVMEALGVQDVLTKVIGSRNPHNVVKATLNALGKLKSARELAASRGKNLQEIVGVAHGSAQQA